MKKNFLILVIFLMKSNIKIKKKKNFIKIKK